MTYEEREEFLAFCRYELSVEESLCSLSKKNIEPKDLSFMDKITCTVFAAASWRKHKSRVYVKNLSDEFNSAYCDFVREASGKRCYEGWFDPLFYPDEKLWYCGRLGKALEDAGITTVSQLANIPEDTIKKIEGRIGFGKVSRELLHKEIAESKMKLAFIETPEYKSIKAQYDEAKEAADDL